MPNHSDQKVIAVCDFSERMKDVILHAVKMADILKKELCLLAIWKNKKQSNEFQEKMRQITKNLKTNLPEMQISSLLLQGSLRSQMDTLADNYNAVIVVLHQADVKYGLKAFRESTIAFLFVNGSFPEYLTYKNVLVPVDYRKATKEASLWASYLGRFNKSQIVFVFARETKSDQSEKLLTNLNFLKKFLSSLYVKHYFVEGKTSSWGILEETLERAHEWNGDVLILAGSKYISLIDLLIGLPEEKLIRKAGNLPILIINPRKDNCVLCD